MKKQKNKRFIVFMICAVLWLIAVFVCLLGEILKNSRTVVLKANRGFDEQQKEEVVVTDTLSDRMTKSVATTIDQMIKEEEEARKKAEEEKKKKEEEEKRKAEEEAKKARTFTTRLTSYWVNDECNSADMTASGLYSVHFQLNENGWYTYKGMLVVATASTRLGKTNMKTFKLYDQITLVIKGKSYRAIVLDVCGACMRDNRVDLYVKDGAHAPGGYATVYY